MPEKFHNFGTDVTQMMKGMSGGNAWNVQYILFPQILQTLWKACCLHRNQNSC